MTANNQQGSEQSSLAKEVERQAKLLRDKLTKVKRTIDKLERGQLSKKKNNADQILSQIQRERSPQPTKAKPKRTKTLQSLNTNLAESQTQEMKSDNWKHEETQMASNEDISQSQKYTTNNTSNAHLLDSRSLERRPSILLNPEELAERQYQLQIRLQRRRRQQQLELLMRQSFSLIKRDWGTIQQEQNIKNRRFRYGDSVSPTGRIDKVAELDARIKLDKNRNPVKYVILGKRGLRDEEIYWSKADYEVQRVESRKLLGNQYLSLSKKRLKTSVQPLDSIKSPVNAKKYIDYLPLVKQKRAGDTVDRILHSKRSKGEKLANLVLRTEQLEGELNVKVEEFARANHSKKTTFQKEAELQEGLDRRLLQSIKTKLAITELL